jgi:hypothetical protein
MHYLHYKLKLGPDKVIQVNLSIQANLRLMDDKNYELYREGEKYAFHGGLATVSPANVKPPKAGEWHLCIDLGGKEGEIKATVNVITEPPAKK